MYREYPGLSGALGGRGPRLRGIDIAGGKEGISDQEVSLKLAALLCLHPQDPFAHASQTASSL